MKHRPLFCLVALAVFHPFVSAQSSCDKPFVVSQVTLPSTTHLSGSEQAAIRARLIGRCIDDQKLTELTGVVQDELQSLGYFRATVTEPAVIASDGVASAVPCFAVRKGRPGSSGSDQPWPFAAGSANSPHLSG